MTNMPAVIGGEKVFLDDKIEVVDPSTEALLGAIPRGGPAEVQTAVDAARQAHERWRRSPAEGRAGVLRRIGAVVRENLEALADLECHDTGKPLSQARRDALTAAEYFEFYADALRTMYGDVLPRNGSFVADVHHVPLGVTGHIIPWNYPIQIAARTVAPSIAMGNCAVLKPAENASFSVIRLAELALEAGLPGGVLNVVPGLGREAGQALARSPEINHLSFTGSVDVGRTVAIDAAANLVPVALELGGKSPNIVFPDADLDAAVLKVTQAIIQNAGQTCSAGSRLIVHDEVADGFLERLAASLDTVSIDVGWHDPDLGPLISREQRAGVETRVAEAEASGARRLTSSARDLPATGYFYPPVLLTDVDPSAPIAQEEVFGPVLVANRFGSTQEAIDLANGTAYALVAGVWTHDLDIAHTMFEEVRAGQLFVNTYGAGGGVSYPFGGLGHSGYGREKGVVALHEFSQTKCRVTQVTDLDRD
jgi:aldehyde dehydrogenase (NAD+)